MYALFAVINKKEMVRPVIKRLREIGIRGATVIESTGAGRYARRENHIPLIGGLRYIDGTDITHNATVFSVIETREQVEQAADEIEKLLGGDMTVPGTGIIFSVPVDLVRGGDLTRYIKAREERNKNQYVTE